MCLSLTASAADGRQAALKSKGTLNVEDQLEGEVCINSTDLKYLANQIDALEQSYKATAVQSLEVVGQTAPSTSWSDICSAIEHSQDVTSGAIADNITKDKQAWVQGVLVTGNGAGEDAAYRRGLTDGLNQALSGAHISYVYHQHTADCTRTCRYRGSKHKTSSTVGCSRCGNNKTKYVYGWSGHTCDPLRNRHVTGYRCEDCNGEPGGGDNWYDFKEGWFTHTYYVCGKTTDTIESATIVFD